MVLRWPAVRLTLFGVAALAVLKVVVLPAYQDHTVLEALPVRSAATQPARSAPFHGIDQVRPQICCGDNPIE